MVKINQTKNKIPERTMRFFATIFSRRGYNKKIITPQIKSGEISVSRVYRRTINSTSPAEITTTSNVEAGTG